MNTFFDLFKDFLINKFDTFTCKNYILDTLRAKKLYTDCAQVLNKISTGDYMTSQKHTPVLTNQVIKYLLPFPGKIFIDATLGLGGHTEAILTLLKNKGAVYGIEIDERNLALAKKRLSCPNIHFIHDNFENLDQHGQEILKREGRIDGILFDLGLSSLHLEEAPRGFSFQREGPLDMRFDTRQRLTAGDIVNTYPLKKLLSIFQTYGEEKFSYRIAQNILRTRAQNPFTTTTQLADFIAAHVPKRYCFKIHPATRIFQALRIATNREIEVLKWGLTGAMKVVSPGGRIVVISYHSLEDRLVKNFFRENKKLGLLRILTKKPIIPDEQEKFKNPRSRSAKLRAFEKIEGS